MNFNTKQLAIYIYSNGKCINSQAANTYSLTDDLYTKKYVYVDGIKYRLKCIEVLIAYPIATVNIYVNKVF